MTVKISPPPRRILELPADTRLASVSLEETRNAVYMEIPASTSRDAGRDTAAQFFVFFLPATLLFTFLWHADADAWQLLAPPWAITLLLFVVNLLIPVPLPVRLNRQTQEIYYMRGRTLYRVSWARLHAFVRSCILPGGPLHTLVFSFPPPPGRKSGCTVEMGTGFEPEFAYRYWDYYYQYMTTGEIVLAPFHETAESIERRKRVTEGVFGWLMDLATYPAMPFLRLSQRVSDWTIRPTRWPQEIIAVCEGHPLLQGQQKLEGRPPDSARPDEQGNLPD